MARHRYAVTILVSILTVPLPSPGGSSAHAESLMEALASAEAANPALAAERQRQRATGEAVPQAIAQGLPSVSTSFDSGQTYENFHAPDARESRRPYGYSVSASVPLFRGLQTVNSVREARARVRAGDQRLSVTAQELFADVATAYADVLRDRQVVRLQGDNLRFLSSELTAIRERQSAGDKSRTDVAQAEARREQARADLSQASADLVESEARYASLVGRVPGQLDPVRIPENLLPATLEEALTLADVQGPVVAAARADAEAADHQAQVRQGALLPTVSLEANYENRRNESLDFSGQEETTLLARLTLPLFEGGARWSRAREAQSNSIARRYDYAQARSATAAGVIAAFRRRLAAGDRIAASNAQLQAAETALKGVRLEAEVGQRSVMDVLDAQRELVSARIAVANSERDLTVATFTLLAALGIADPGSIFTASARTPAAAPPAAPAGATGLRSALEPDATRDAPVRARAGPVALRASEGHEPVVIARGWPVALRAQAASMALREQTEPAALRALRGSVAPAGGGLRSSILE